MRYRKRDQPIMLEELRNQVPVERIVRTGTDIEVASMRSFTILGATYHDGRKLM